MVEQKPAALPVEERSHERNHPKHRRRHSPAPLDLLGGMMYLYLAIGRKAYIVTLRGAAKVDLMRHPLVIAQSLSDLGLRPLKAYSLALEIIGPD